MHDVAPENEKVPAGHLSQDKAPNNAEYSPAAQSVQIVEPVVLENLPGAHFEHEDEPAEEYSPTAHFVQEAAPASEYVPAVQLVQVDEDAPT